MNRANVAVLLTVALVLGAGAGAYGGFAYATSIVGRMENDLAGVRAIADVSSSVAMLESLRGSNTGAVIEPLETRLDNALVTVDALPRGHLPVSAPVTLRRAAEYRARNPRKSITPVIEDTVQRVLAKAKE